MTQDVKQRPSLAVGAPDDTLDMSTSLHTARSARADFEARKALPMIVDEIVTGNLGRRMVQDMLTEATASYWEGRAEVLADVVAAPGEFIGQATAEDITALNTRAADDALRCRRHAALLRSMARGTELLDELGIAS